MTFKVIADGQAKLEWNEAIDWYEQCERGIGLQFDDDTVPRNPALLDFFKNQSGKSPLYRGLSKFDNSGDPCAPGVGVCFFPPHPNPLPEERESAGTALENSNIAVAVTASLSFVSEANDNQAR
jgi:hypothetical protein